MSVIHCVCCNAPATVPEGSSVGAQAAASGFCHFFNQRSGLTTTWVCVPCMAKVQRASELLRQVFGDDFEFIHMVGIAKLSASTPEESS